MTEFRKILSSIVSRLRERIPGIEIQTQDIEEGFKRPSFFVELDNMRNEDFMNKLLDRKLTIRILYFPPKPNKNQTELLKMMDDLTKNFIEENYIEIDDFLVEVENADIRIVDKVLHFSFEIFISESYIRELEAENMGDVTIE